MSTHCDEVFERLVAFMDNELDTASGEEIRAHLAACEPCMDEARVVDVVKQLLRRACRESAPPQLRMRVTAEITTLRARIIS